ncbi:iron-sulfur cluster repair protein YtfE [Thiomonas sp.]|uniref:iron-sulfur cluster repair protein YtfE n=1 Tax=Thiomonas sp. TaxID=2047785 RepID=UPI002620B902|nr:iron-sulfur cluster repair protein YtfE [Thiomonas sp.]
MNTVPERAAPLRDSRLGDIARTLAGATAVLRRHKLDFCCGGDATLAEAAQRRGADVARIEAELDALDPAAAPVLPDEPAELVAHIVTRFHDVHRAELPELIALAAKVERVHREHAAAPAGLADALQRMRDELLEHMHKEEQILFPMMAANPGARLDPPIQRMRAEHDDHGEALAELFALTDDLALPDDACNSWRALYLGLRKFTEDLTEHIHTENNVLFPRFESAARG